MPVLPQVDSRRPVSTRRRLRPRAVASWLFTASLAAVALGVFALGVGPRLLPYRAYAIHTGSMAPALPVGSEAILRPVAAIDLRPGDVIAFHKPSGGAEMVTHRIFRVETVRGERRFVTKGDANDVPDAWRVPAEGAGWRVVASVPYAGYVVQSLRTPIPRLLVIAVVLVWFGGVAIRRIWSRPAVTTTKS